MLILVLFEAISGLHVNRRKSCLYPVNWVHNIQVLAVIVGCQVESLPATYLGLPLGSKSKAQYNWSGVLKRGERRLETWKSQYLSLGDRMVLVNSVLDALPTCHVIVSITSQGEG